MNTVKILVNNGKIIVTSPYNPSFATPAKNLGGRWDPTRKAWIFDSRDEARVRSLCVSIYGTDGSPVDLVTVRHTITSGESGPATLFLYGREIARRQGRDADVQLGSGVILIEGRFPGRGGSTRYPTLEGQGVILEIREVPRSLIEDGDVIVDETPVMDAPKSESVTITLTGNAFMFLQQLRASASTEEIDTDIITDALKHAAMHMEKP